VGERLDGLPADLSRRERVRVGDVGPILAPAATRTYSVHIVAERASVLIADSIRMVDRIFGPWRA